MADQNPTTDINLWHRLPLWLFNHDERLVFTLGGKPKFRWPWSRLMSVLAAKESRVFGEGEHQHDR